MSDRVKMLCRLAGALILASVGLSVGYLLTGGGVKIGWPWIIPFAFVEGAATGAGFFLIWLNRIERY